MEILTSMCVHLLLNMPLWFIISDYLVPIAYAMGKRKAQEKLEGPLVTTGEKKLRHKLFDTIDKKPMGVQDKDGKVEPKSRHDKYRKMVIITESFMYCIALVLYLNMHDNLHVCILDFF